MTRNRSERSPASGRRASADDVRLGNRVALLRKTRHISQAEMARKLGVTPQQYQKYERGTNRIGAVRLYEIAIALGVRIQYFYENLGEGEAAPHESDSDVSAEDFLWILARLKSRESRWRVLRLISALVSEEENPAG
jgi:transcriptional regulator with XRE-family HTH domain